MSADRPLGDTALAGLLAAAVGVCCGLPVLLSVGAGATIAGLGLRSWLLAGAGLIGIVVAAVRLRQHRACKLTPSTDRHESNADAHADRTG
ncbi:MAG TPA: hypothetical protein VLL25_14305 [Acidimicrobiales bacterium]|nr:hypothetical protein [Acidimicrobiales bacterium]